MWNRKYSILLLLTIILLVLWASGLISLWIKGISYIANNTEKFTDRNSSVLAGSYAITIDLNDLQSNLEKELYNDGSNRIYVSWLKTSDSPHFGGYQIGFRSSGNYSLSKAMLVSGIKHATLNNNSFYSCMSAKMTAEYRGEIYNCQEAGESGLNYKDGDDFWFYIFPNESYQSGEVSLNEKGMVLLCVRNLYKNVWTKADSQQANSPTLKKKGITMLATPEICSPAARKLSLKISNHQSAEASTGMDYTIEYLNGTVWTEIPLQFAVNDLKIILLPDASRKIDIYLYPEQYQYKAGQYRICKTVSTAEKEYKVYAPFTIRQLVK